MHGLLTGEESRQQLYTMLTRGRHANHLYLQVVGDGDPHSIIRPDTISPRTPTEKLQQILARDEAPVSASTLLRELNDPAARLFQAVQRYTDSLHVAAEQLLGPQAVAELDRAEQYIPGLTVELAWPTLRAHLLALTAETGEHPLHHLLTAAGGGDLRPADDMAAVLDWRLTALTPTPPRSAALAPRHSSNAAYPILSGAATWQGDPNLLPTLPTRCKITPARVAVRQRGLEREVVPTLSFAKSQYGGPPTASIPKTRGQREKAANSIQPLPCGNSDSTGRSPVPRQAARDLTNDKQHKPHLVAPTATAGARTNTRSESERASRTPPLTCRRAAAAQGLRFTHGSDGTQPLAEFASNGMSSRKRATIRCRRRRVRNGIAVRSCQRSPRRQ